MSDEQLPAWAERDALEVEKHALHLVRALDMAGPVALKEAARRLRAYSKDSRQPAGKRAYMRALATVIRRSAG